MPRDVYANNPFVLKRGNQPHVVWDEVKFLKKHTANGTTVDQKYTHVCLTRITSAKAVQEGEDEDEEGNWIWYCNKLFSLKKGKTCYNTSQAANHIKMHGDTTKAGKALGKRADTENEHKGAVKEAATCRHGQPSGAVKTYSISRDEMCLGKMVRC